MNIETEISKILNENLAPQNLILQDQSSRHNDHNEQARNLGQTHFALEIVSEKFADLSRVERQRMIYELLDEIFKTTQLHALTMKLLTPEEAAK